MPKRSGPPRLPANVVRIRGNASKLSAEELEAREAEEVKARPLRPGPPAHLSPHARECWQKIAPELEHLGLLTVLDGPGFELACETYALAKYALEELRPKKADGTPDGRKKHPELLDVDRAHGQMTKKNPAFAVYAQASREFRAWCVEFGLSPSARASLRPGARGAVAGEVPDREDDDDAFFGT